MQNADETTKKTNKDRNRERWDNEEEKVNKKKANVEKVEQKEQANQE